MISNFIKKKIKKAEGTVLRFTKGERKILKVEAFFNKTDTGKVLCIRYTTEDDYFYVSYTFNLKTILFFLFPRKVKGYTAGNNKDYIIVV